MAGPDPSGKRKKVQGLERKGGWGIPGPRRDASELGGAAVAAKLGLTQPAVSRAILRGERLANEQRLVFPKG